ncbi:GrpB family protein [Saccharopolyspora erythraea]|uniref:GrpB family protein n=1 Tax=Saccharopolyspora erythraea TaxID=1836 RepID=UPI002011437E|nr:GrpB family protein [Saccharopolyspora erythraea]
MVSSGGLLVMERAMSVGSTSVPGLCATPVIDVLLVVADSADASSYVPALRAAGYVLRVRESDWFEHRLFKGRAGGGADVGTPRWSTAQGDACRPGGVLICRDRCAPGAADVRSYIRESGAPP